MLSITEDLQGLYANGGVVPMTQFATRSAFTSTIQVAPQLQVSSEVFASTFVKTLTPGNVWASFNASVVNGGSGTQYNNNVYANLVVDDVVSVSSLVTTFSTASAVYSQISLNWSVPTQPGVHRVSAFIGCDESNVVDVASLDLSALSLQ
jgi:hypothetical protein